MTNARIVTRLSPVLWVALGALSLASGVLLIVSPIALGSVYGLPRSRWLLRLIGARDVVIGGGLLATTDVPWFMWARAVSDATDAVLIGLEGYRTDETLLTCCRIAVACCVAGIAGALAFRNGSRLDA
jgi:hypothetical protein